MSGYIQTTLFNFLDLAADPIFTAINKMEIGEILEIAYSTVNKKWYGYEVENEYYHEGYLDVRKCYDLVIKVLELKENILLR